jgi:N-methylhydantoinase B/oxoprolinase/acetone carboxylase alpha subunit
VSIISERRKFSPYGVLGGETGKKGMNSLISNKRKKKVLGPKVNLKVQPGDILRIETPGGGGYGKKK